MEKKTRKKSQNHLQPPIARLTKKSSQKQNMTVIESGKSRRLSEMSGKKSNRHNSRQKSRDAIHQESASSSGFAVKENRNAVSNFAHRN